MSASEGSQALTADACQRKPDDPGIVAVGNPSAQPCVDGTVDQPDDAVVLHLEVLRDVRDRWALWAPVSAYRKEKLVVGRGETRSGGLFLTPPLESAQARAKLEEP
jgi:hypothetical protein